MVSQIDCNGGKFFFNFLDVSVFHLFFFFFLSPSHLKCLFRNRMRVVLHCLELWFSNWTSGTLEA